MFHAPISISFALSMLFLLMTFLCLAVSCHIDSIGLLIIFKCILNKEPKSDEIILFPQVALSVFLDYFRAIGLIATCTFFFFFACYQAVNVFSSIWLSQWTADSILQNASLSGTSEYTNRNEMYLGVYGGLGAGQGNEIVFGMMTHFFLFEYSFFRE